MVARAGKFAMEMVNGPPLGVSGPVTPPMIPLPHASRSATVAAMMDDCATKARRDRQFSQLISRGFTAAEVEPQRTRGVEPQRRQEGEPQRIAEEHGGHPLRVVPLRPSASAVVRAFL